jgi:DEAD/DEAH box helicase domain-containing protein
MFKLLCRKALFFVGLNGKNIRSFDRDGVKLRIEDGLRSSPGAGMIFYAPVKFRSALNWMSMVDLDFLNENNWRLVDVLHTAGREAALESIDGLSLAAPARAFIERSYPAGIYHHQKLALQASLAGEPVCLSTGTSSGKSLVFQAAALDILGRDPQACVMAIYPMKALGNEQRERWDVALQAGGFDLAVGRVDGNVPPGMRLGILERSRVVVFTPDILHAWLFSNLNQSAVISFLTRVSLVVVDEVHAYSGVFGSNAAFLFRRLRHLLALLGTKPRFICASATIARPEQHLDSLFGLSFHLVGAETDTSPRYPLEVALVEPPPGGGAMDAVVALLDNLANHQHARFITFVDSRKQVELISSILARMQREANAKPEPEEAEYAEEARLGGMLSGLNILPYRAGYEEHDRGFIQSKLTDGTLAGVVSTSALELGIDIPDLDTCVLIGVPASATSLQQRIGRIGRRAPGTVIVVNGGDVYDRAVFANPPSFFERPLAESALYLQNRYIQYIHALCLARDNGEHAQVLHSRRLTSKEFMSPVRWPENFLDLCRAERAGQTPRDLLGMKNEAHDRPNYAFPLREVESQFKVERAQGPTPVSLGSLSFGQLMREAYPGAIYYYATQPYRVTRVNLKTRQIQVRREKRYTTRPNRMPDRVFPRLNPSGVFTARCQDDLLSLECQLLVRETINGVVEQRGGNESVYPYPLPRELGYYQDQPFFNRNYFTSGTVLSHPALSAPGVFPPALAELIYEAFLLLIPFDRQDIGWAADSFRQPRPPSIAEGQPFLSVFDQVYGSLRLSGRLLEPDLLGRVLLEAGLLAATQGLVQINPAGRAALGELCAASLDRSLRRLSFGSVEVNLPPGTERVILPGSKGLLLRSSEEFRVIGVVRMPNGVSYEGVPASLEGSSAATMPLLSDVAEIPGESQVASYNPLTEAIEPLAESQLGLSVEPGEETVQIEAEPIADSLSMHLEVSALTNLAEELHLAVDLQAGRPALALEIAQVCLRESRLGDLARAIARL